MRRFFQLFGVLVLAVILFSISAVATPSTVKVPERPPMEPVRTPTPIIQVDQPYHATIEYGIPEVIKHNDGPLFTYIRFPQGGNSTDDEIAQWAYQFYDDRVNEFYFVQEDEPDALGEINVHFDSYLVDNRYAGIFQSGDYSYYLSMPKESVLKTFNIDLTTASFLSSADILDFSQTEDIIAPLLRDRLLAEHPGTYGHLNFIDETWLGQLVITQDGIMVVIEGRTLLQFFDTLTATLPYEDLGAALRIRTEPPLDVAPTPAPTPVPTPDPVHGGPDDPVDTGSPDDTTQSFPPQSDNIDRSGLIIALSFDDGPGVYTDQFLDLLEKYNVRATFCTIGNLVNTQKEALARAVEMGCEVIGHSWDHKNLAKLSADDVKKQLVDTMTVIEAVTGTATPMFRPPYGEVNTTMKDVAAELGLSLVNWNVDPEDWNTKDPDAVYNAVMHQVKNNAIILSHEIYKSTLIAYQRLIPDLLAHGYQIVTVSELLTIRLGELEPGRVYYNG